MKNSIISIMAMLLVFSFGTFLNVKSDYRTIKLKQDTHVCKIGNEINYVLINLSEYTLMEYEGMGYYVSNKAYNSDEEAIIDGISKEGLYVMSEMNLYGYVPKTIKKTGVPGMLIATQEWVDNKKGIIKLRNWNL